MNSKLIKFGIYTNNKLIKIITDINREKTTELIFPTSEFTNMSNSEIINRIKILGVSSGLVRIWRREKGLSMINTLDYAYLGQIEDKNLISEIEKEVRKQLRRQ